MNEIFARSLSLAQDYLDRQPDLALMLGSALFAFWSRQAFQPTATAATPAPAAPASSSLWPTLIHRAGRFAFAGILTTALLAVHTGVKSYLGQIDRNFSAHHGRVTEANEQAVRTIWGSEQRQTDLQIDLTYEEEVEERVQSADLDKPDIIHKVKKERTVEGNPFRAEHHAITLKTNARKKGSAMYAGYETDCHFTWDLVNPADREIKAALRFPLPSSYAVYSDFTVALDGVDVLPQAHFANGALLLDHTFAAGQACKLTLAFQSRGLAWWYFQIATQRELRDFTLDLHLPDVAAADLNYPEGCMTPTLVTPDATSGGSTLTFRLDHALTTKGMGVDLPKLTQPGLEAGSVLGEAARGFTMFFALVLIGLVILNVPHTALITALAGIPAAYAFGLLGDLSDTALPFWAAWPLALGPLMLLVIVAVQRFASRAAPIGNFGKFGTFGRAARTTAWILTLAAAMMILAYPLAAGLDDSRFMMYRNIAGLLWLGTLAWLLVRQHRLNATAN